MAVGCSNNCMKYILLFFNLIIVILGIAGIALGAVLLGKKDLFLKGLDAIKFANVFDDFNNETIKAGAIILIIASVVIVLISFLGCVGAWKENKCMLGMYSAVMFVLLALQVAAFITVIVAEPKLKTSMKSALKTMIEKADTDEKRKAIEKLFEINKCCGIDSPKDIVNSTIDCNEKYPGCYTLAKESIKQNLPAAIGISVAIIMVQLFLIVFACCLCLAKRGETIS